MNVCSAIVHAKPENAVGVSSRLEEFPGVEVHGGKDVGKLIVTVEGGEDDTLADIMAKFGDVEGVISTVMIYHYSGEEADSEEVIQ
ncbi:chaperone NapD [Solemya velesiana gill symbiont]|uniref:Chaperone NapD n=1 Tax=Solemya velesiana gill symbiont TaxID=1918948 RepID=A0A1T2KUG9_9GAMM|nr:chaperone NapD [Solemya velesiana gill symbiont]OOZ36495.1 ferredoxin [Solemya velesiana gill symbiont]